jgi:pimeloyl-ACP methyl ester carboxylesterase
MTYVILVLGWLFAIIFGLLTASMLLMNNWPHALALFLVVLLCLPPISSFIQNRFGWSIHPVLRGVLIVGLLFVFVRLLTNVEQTSIYNSPEVEAQFMERYDAKMQQWPIPYEDLFIETSYGTVHVIASGPQDASPMLLLHASGVGGWSWLYNVEALSRNYRTYALDTLGDAGKSKLNSVDHYPGNGQEQAALLIEVTQALKIEQAYVVGASEGGFIGTNYSLYAPERVKKLVLLGPMGYAGTNASVMRIMLAQFFPLKPIQDSTTRWAFGESTEVVKTVDGWFQLFMTETFPKKARPTEFSAEQRQSLSIPILLVLGKNDQLVGNPENAIAKAQDIPNIQFEVLDTGHLIGVEDPDAVNKLILEFFEESEQ